MNINKILRAPCPACGVVDRVVRASPAGGYRMIRHKAPLQRYRLRASLCTGRALIAVDAIVEQARKDRTIAEGYANSAVAYREKLRAEYERAVAMTTDGEIARRAEIAALDKVIAKLTGVKP